MRKYILHILILLGILAASLIFFYKCESKTPDLPITPDKTDSIKKVNYKLEHERDSLLVIAKKKDSVRVDAVAKYRSLKGKVDSIPCDSLLPQIVNICDSIVLVDSSEIASLKEIIKLDSGIISNYKKIVVNDSTTIAGLNKQIKKHKRQKKWLGVGMAAAIGIAIFK